jgi:hypothetical protein
MLENSSSLVQLSSGDNPIIILFSDGLGLLSKVARIKHFKVAI